MRISVSAAKAQLTDLVRRAERGEEITLTRRGKDVITLTPTKPAFDPEARLRFIQSVMDDARGKATPGPCAARSQDFLYDEDGLPA